MSAANLTKDNLIHTLDITTPRLQLGRFADCAYKRQQRPGLVSAHVRPLSLRTGNRTKGRTGSDQVLLGRLFEHLFAVELPELFRRVLSARLEQHLLAARVVLLNRGQRNAKSQERSQQACSFIERRETDEELGHVVDVALDDDPGAVGRRVLRDLLCRDCLRTFQRVSHSQRSCLSSNSRAPFLAPLAIMSSPRERSGIMWGQAAPVARRTLDMVGMRASKSRQVPTTNSTKPALVNAVKVAQGRLRAATWRAGSSPRPADFARNLIRRRPEDLEFVSAVRTCISTLTLVTSL